jgi:hypothetical protein
MSSPLMLAVMGGGRGEGRIAFAAAAARSAPGISCDAAVAKASAARSSGKSLIATQPLAQPLASGGLDRLGTQRESTCKRF